MIEAIYIAKESNGNQSKVDSVQLIAGKGIFGDRNFNKSRWPGQNITFIETEEINRYNSVFNQNIILSATRRNIVTKGVRLNDLVGKEFKIGKVLFKGIDLCEPCLSLGKLLENKTIQKKEIVKAFTHRGGLRADILNDGSITIGLPIEIQINA